MAYRKYLAAIFVSSLLISTPCFAEPHSSEDSIDRKIHQLVRDNTFTLELSAERISGDGLAPLLKQVQGKNFVLFGESHGVADIARTAEQLYRLVASDQFYTAILEVDPYVTPKLEAMTRTKNNRALKQHFISGQNLLSIPFFCWIEEVDFLNTVLAHSQVAETAFVGLDQVFIAAGEMVLKDLHDLSTTDTEREVSQRALARSKSMPFYVGLAEAEEVEALAAAFTNSRNILAKNLANDIYLSNNIYRPFTGRGGNSNQANQLREDYMKRQLTKHLNLTQGQQDPPPNLFFKFGGSHMMWGHSNTNTLSLGTFVREFATLNNLTATNILVTCLSGEESDIKTGGTNPCEPYIDLQNSSLWSHVGTAGSYYLNLKPMRYSRLFRHFDEASKKQILAYDGMILIADVKASTLFEGTAPAFN
jgi:hypothetical protein